MNRTIKRMGFRLVTVGAVAAAPLIIKNARPIAKALGKVLQRAGIRLQDIAEHSPKDSAPTQEEAVRPGPQEVPMPDPKRSDEVPPQPDIPEAPATPQRPDPHEPQEPTPDPDRRATKVRQTKPTAKTNKPRTAKATPRKSATPADAAGPGSAPVDPEAAAS